jgi:hypothetical protein
MHTLESHLLSPKEQNTGSIFAQIFLGILECDQVYVGFRKFRFNIEITTE